VEKTLSCLGIFALVLIICQLGLSQDVYAAKSTGVMVPLYTYPGSTWDQIIAVKNAYPSVPILAIINPKNGSGSAQDPNYVTGIQSLQSSGIVVLGYVHTNYANRDLNLAMNDTDNYKNWYGVNGIFFDEMSNIVENKNYYASLNSHAKSIGFSITVGNSGVDTSPSYVGVVDNIVIYDNQGLPTLNFLGDWHTMHDKRNFSLLSYGVQTHDPVFAKKASNYVGYIYMSNGMMPNPWGSLSPYLEDLASSMEDESAISVNSAANSGGALAGLWTDIRSSDVVVKTGFTPDTYWLVPGLQYLMCVGDYEHYLFDHWDDGTTQRCRAITPTQNTTLTAYYQTEVITPPNPVAITVQSADGTGSPITGLWTTIYSGTTLVKSGYTTLMYTASANTQYSVCVARYQNYIFDHWEDGSTNSCTTITPTQDTTLTAYYDIHLILTVNSVDPSGSAISGMWTEIYSNGNVTKTGFTPQSYTLPSDLQYVVCMADHLNYSFNRWEDGGASRCRALDNFVSNLTITAHYSISSVN
jgi:hypothetical protein